MYYFFAAAVHVFMARNIWYIQMLMIYPTSWLLEMQGGFLDAWTHQFHASRINKIIYLLNINGMLQSALSYWTLWHHTISIFGTIFRTRILPTPYGAELISRPSLVFGIHTGGSHFKKRIFYYISKRTAEQFSRYCLTKYEELIRSNTNNQRTLHPTCSYLTTNNKELNRFKF